MSYDKTIEIRREQSAKYFVYVKKQLSMSSEKMRNAFSLLTYSCISQFIKMNRKHYFIYFHELHT